MKKVKVLHIIKSLGRGGAEMLLPETLSIHDKAKFDFHYIYFLPWKDQMVAEIKRNEGKVTCLPAKNNIELIGKISQVIEYCKRHDIDLIHCHLPWAGFLGRFVHIKSKIPLVYTEHNMQERYHLVTKTLNKVTFGMQSLVIGVSEDVTNSIKKNISPKIPLKTILNGVNTEKYVREPKNLSMRKDYNIPEDAIVVGLVSVFRFQKRIREWLQVFKKFSDTNSEAFGLIVGAGPLEEEIKSELKRLNLDNKVILTGLQENTIPFFNSMDIFMMTSSFEGLPIALLEAMSMECAIVTTNAGGVKEVVRKNLDGMIVDTDHWQDLPEKLNILSNDPIKLKEYQKAARKRVVEEFSLKIMVKNLEREYLKLVE